MGDSQRGISSRKITERCLSHRAIKYVVVQQNVKLQLFVHPDWSQTPRAETCAARWRPPVRVSNQKLQRPWDMLLFLREHFLT